MNNSFIKKYSKVDELEGSNSYTFDEDMKARELKSSVQTLISIVIDKSYPLNGNNELKECVKRAYRKANLDDKVYTVHTLRHTCATLLYRAGVNLKTIQELLGHVQIDTTEIYTHLHDQEVLEVMMNHPLAQFKMENALAYCA